MLIYTVGVLFVAFGVTFIYFSLSWIHYTVHSLDIYPRNVGEFSLIDVQTNVQLNQLSVGW